MLTLRRSLLVLGAVFVLGWLTPARSQEKQAPGTSQRLDLFGDPLTGGEGVEQLRVNLDGILAEADRILDNLRPINAEEYLQQNRQRGGE